MRNYILMLVMTTTLLNGMDADWFYNPECPYKSANDLYQRRRWEAAEDAYNTLLDQGVGTERDQDMARVNLASCQMAQRKLLTNWKAFDQVCPNPVPADRQFRNEDAERTVLVRTDTIGIGDIAHFLPAVKILKDLPGVKKVMLGLRSFMHAALKTTVAKLGVELVDEKDKDQLASADRVTHLVALLGHLNLNTSELRIEEPLFTADEKAVMRVKSVLDPKLGDNKHMCVLFVGENRAATLMGGKQLPRDPLAHGRQLHAQAFEQLLEREPDLVLVDCNPAKSLITFDFFDGVPENLVMIPYYRDRVVQLPGEETPFDTTIALAQVMNTERQDAVGFAADNGPANMFARALTKRAQRRFAYIIPNPEEYDARMEGEGESYKQMISNCRVYKSTSPDKQAQTIGQAFDDMSIANE